MNIIITGSNGSIGSILVNNLSQNNKIYAIVKNKHSLTFNINSNIEIIECNLTDNKSIDKICADIKIDYIICNAGVGPNSNHNINDLFQINFFSHLQLYKKFKNSQLICISSLAVDDPWINCKNSVVYESSKAALESLCRCREKEINKPCYNIVCGAVKSKMLLEILENDKNNDIWKNANNPEDVSIICKNIIDNLYVYNNRRIYLDNNESNTKVITTLKRKYEFSSSHSLNLDNLCFEENQKIYGKCNNNHGHNYSLNVIVTGKINKYGFIINTKDLDYIVINNIIDVFDHKNINDILVLPSTTENLAQYIQNKLQKLLSNFDIGIELCETSKTSVIIINDNNNNKQIENNTCSECNFDILNIENAFKQLIPDDASKECKINTPKRAAKAWIQNMDHLNSPKLTTFPGKKGILIKQENIPIDSICEHHLLPFFGTATVEYTSNGKIIGLSKIEQMCSYICKGLHLQEEITEKISVKLSELLETEVSVSLKCEHACMRRYGSQKSIVTNTYFKYHFN